ncbi:hypothetical protein, partial [Klebsiella pneumoniae]|uniref:hypothetical protein n=1 Tax=Klebsiella pneumoniae TaxID=573 RepID=UPI002730B9FB
LPVHTFTRFHLSFLTSSLLLAVTPSFAEAATEDAKLDTEVRVIGSISDMLLAEDSAQALIDKLASHRAQ